MSHNLDKRKIFGGDISANQNSGNGYYEISFYCPNSTKAEINLEFNGYSSNKSFVGKLFVYVFNNNIYQKNFIYFGTLVDTIIKLKYDSSSEILTIYLYRKDLYFSNLSYYYKSLNSSYFKFNNQKIEFGKEIPLDTEDIII